MVLKFHRHSNLYNAGICNTCHSITASQQIKFVYIVIKPNFDVTKHSTAAFSRTIYVKVRHYTVDCHP